MITVAEGISDDNKYQVEVVDMAGYDKYRLCIYHIDSLLEEHYDLGEPEDASFVRDYDWIVPALITAYNHGFEGGYQQALKDAVASFDLDKVDIKNEP